MGTSMSAVTVHTTTVIPDRNRWSWQMSGRIRIWSAALIAGMAAIALAACSTSKPASLAARPAASAQAGCGNLPSYPGLTAVVYFLPDATPTEMNAVQAAARSLSVTTAVVVESKAQMSARQRIIACRHPDISAPLPNQEAQQSLWISTKGPDYNAVNAALGGLPGIDFIANTRVPGGQPNIPGGA
jgi:hypothetical protein